MLKDNIEHAINLPSKGKILLWIDNDLECNDQRELYQILILSRLQGHIMDLMQNAEGATRLQLKFHLYPP